MPKKASERNRDVARKRQQRADAKTIVIPACENLERRKQYEEDDESWLRYYCGNLFWYEFTPQQKAMIAAIRNAIIFGGDQALAASRGEGKTKLCERMLLKYTLQGRVKFAVLFAATGSSAENSLQSLRDEIERNDLLALDYPEVCIPVRALEDTPNRAHYQLVSGKRHDNGEPFERVSSKFTWCGSEIICPNVPGSPAALGIIATRGLDSAVRGLNKKNKRPDVVVIDDPDTEETVRSEEQAGKLEERIDRGIAGLGGQQRGVARIMLTTLQRRDCVSAWFTDPKRKPSWKGKRFRFLIQKPDRLDLWDEYVQQRIANQQAVDDDGNHTDEFARGAHNFYLTNRIAMDAGAIVANPHRHNPQVLPDGSQLEVSALERYYNEVARIGQEAVSTEYDNDPPEETGPMESGITALRIQRQLSGYQRRIVPPECTIITQGIDVRKTALHWVIRAWCKDGTGYTIDYGVYDIGTNYGAAEAVDVAIRNAILGRIDETRDTDYLRNDQPLPVDLTLVDSGWRTDAVYSACLDGGMGVLPVKGFGRSAGCIQANFSEVQRQTIDKKPGDGWFLSRQGTLWLVCADTDRWKAFEHDRWLTKSGLPGCMYLFGDAGDPDGPLTSSEREHYFYARHLTAEVEVEEINKGILRRRWKPKSEQNHWLDASYYATVAASIKGIHLLRQSKRTSTIPGQQQSQAPSLQQLADRAKANPTPRSLAEMKAHTHAKTPFRNTHARRTF